MQAITLNGTIDSDGYLQLNVPTQLSPGQVDIVLVIHPADRATSGQKQYNFSDLAGTLEWQGNPLIVQRALRNEW